MNCACGKSLPATNKSGKCKACYCRFLNTDPEMRARRSAGILAHYNEPGVREMRRNALLRAMTGLSDDERKRRSEYGKIHARAVLLRPDVMARAQAPDAIRRRSAGHTEAMMGWCPPDRRAEYRHLIKNKHYKREEAMAMILETVPGTPEHARRSVANAETVMLIKRERDIASRY
jgi:hypothetical protein